MSSSISARIMEVEIPSLEIFCQLRLAITFWTVEGLSKRIFKEVNGLIQMDEALIKLKKFALSLPLSLKLKNRFVDIIEQVGYEILVFTTKSPVNFLDSKLNLFHYIIWTPFGSINEESTYESLINKNFQYNQCIFKSACLMCREELIIKIWNGLNNFEKNQLKFRGHNLLVVYWIHFLEGTLDEFILSHGHTIIGFEPYKSKEFNMVKHCINSNLKTALFFFFNLLSEIDKQYFLNNNKYDNKFSSYPLHKVLIDSKPEYFKYIRSFLEMPSADLKTYKWIIGEMPNEGVLEFIDNLLKQVNVFGDLHYKILRRIVNFSNSMVKEKLISKLDFYVLNLIGKGRLETFEGLLPQVAKSILNQQLSNRLDKSTGLSLFYTILNNNHTHLLIQCCKYISTNKTDEKFFKTHIDLLINGSQYNSIS